jgi:hypothetical protein
MVAFLEAEQAALFDLNADIATRLTASGWPRTQGG